MSATMVVQQPTPVMVAVGSNQWSSGICDCSKDVPDCCFGFWCLPCYACKLSRDYGECLCLPLLDGCGFIPAVAFSMRSSMRQRYGIRGTMCKDCLYSTFCYPCSWCQMSREMKQRVQNITLINARVHS